MLLSITGMISLCSVQIFFLAKEAKQVPAVLKAAINLIYFMTNCLKSRNKYFTCFFDTYENSVQFFSLRVEYLRMPGIECLFDELACKS